MWNIRLLQIRSKIYLWYSWTVSTHVILIGPNLKKSDTSHNSARENLKICQVLNPRYPPEPVSTEITYVETVYECHRWISDRIWRSLIRHMIVLQKIWKLTIFRSDNPLNRLQLRSHTSKRFISAIGVVLIEFQEVWYVTWRCWRRIENWPYSGF